MLDRMGGAVDTTIRMFDQLREPLLRYLLSLRLSIPDAEEIVQEVFLSLYQHLREGKPESNLRAWTFTVAHHLGLKRRMSNQRRLTLLPNEAIDRSPDPEERLADIQRQSHLRAVMRALPEQDQWCLVLRAEGLPCREIATVLDMSLGSVANSLERSIARLTRADRRIHATRY
jgi:RNA polymerase sigma-70 factor (ECF subfamily)